MAANPVRPRGSSRDSDELVAAVIRVLRESQSLSGAEPIESRTRLLKAGLGLDSVAVLEFVIALEAEFDCRIDDEEISPRWFASVGAAVELIRSKRSERGA